MSKFFAEVFSRLERIEMLLGATQPAPMTLEEAATYLHISKSTLYRWTSQSRIAHFKTSKRCFFLREDLDRFLLAHRVSSREEVERDV